MNLMDKESQRWYCFNDDQVWLGNEKRWGREVSQTKLSAMAAKYGGNVSSFEAVYIDGFANLEMGGALIALTESSLNIFLENTQTELEIRYDSIESLNVNLDREITASRTFVLGPVLAAYFKQETKVLTIGFKDELGLIQTPIFKLKSKEELTKCYNSIREQIRKRKMVTKRAQR